ncbi:MAG: hypothetical protein M1824_000973 [Vezdaea acicularis]|nr:MAG: hypothetical protein M1824_000973 [Vezdaea acicularis]
MPPRKSDPATVAGDESTTTPSKDKDAMSIDDLTLPRTMVTRLGKGVLPANTNINKDAMLAMSKSATVFVNYLSAQANEIAAERHGKKRIEPLHVFEALEQLEFESFIPRLKEEVNKYSDIQTAKRNAYRKKPSLGTAANSQAGPYSPANLANGTAHPSSRGEDSEPAAKKPRRSGIGSEDEDESEIILDDEAEMEGQGDEVDEEDDGDTEEDVNEDEQEETMEGREENEVVNISSGSEDED